MDDSVTTGEVMEQNTETGDFKLVMDDGRIESLGEYISPEELFEDLINRVRKYHPSDDISLIEKACYFFLKFTKKKIINKRI